MHISWEAKPGMKYTFSRFTRWNKIIFIQKILNFLSIIYNFKRDKFFALNDIIHIHTLRHINLAKTETVGAGAEKVKITANPDNLITKIFPCNLAKKTNTHTLCFCPLIRKLQAFEILEWAQRGQWRKQRTSNFTHEIQLIFSRLWNTTFFIFSRLWNTAF